MTNKNREQYEKEMLDLYNRSLKQGKEDQFSAIFCPTNYGEPCILCDMCKEILFDKRTYDKTPAQEKARELNRKNHYFSNIIFIANPMDIVLFDYGEKYIFNKLLGYQMDPDSDHKDFFHPIRGKNITITKQQLGADRKSVSYDVEARSMATKLPNMAVLQKLEEDIYNLDHITENIRAGKIRPLPQYKLPVQKTELRWLPSWLGPDIPKFYTHIIMHHNISDIEFTAIQNGKLDPFKLLRTKTSVYIQQPSNSPVDDNEGKLAALATMQSLISGAEEVAKKTVSKWGAYVDATTPVKPAAKLKTIVEPPTDKVLDAPLPDNLLEEDEPQPVLPACYGKLFDANNTECTEECAEDGWMAGCQKAMESANRLAARQRAKKVAK